MSRPVALRRLALAALAAAAAVLVATPEARAHGASKGMHVHLTPDPAAPGARITVRVNVSEPVVRLRLGWAGETPKEVQRKRARRAIRVKLRVPAEPGAGTLSLGAEAETPSGRTYRGSAVLRVAGSAASRRARASMPSGSPEALARPSPAPD